MPAQWVSQQLSNRNFLSPVGFKLELDLFPETDFLCQQAAIPDISAIINEVSTPRRRLPIPASGGTQFGDLVVTFLVDEDIKNYIKLASKYKQRKGVSVEKWSGTFAMKHQNLLQDVYDRFIEYNKFHDSYPFTNADKSDKETA